MRMTSSGSANAGLEPVRRIRRITEVLAELPCEYEAKPNPQNLESIKQRAGELAGLSVRLRTISHEERSTINQTGRRER